MRKILVVVLCGFVLTQCCGCMSILGAIIGHQSGELCAGLAIGAALDFGEDVARGVGEVLADTAKEFEKNSHFNADDGTMALPAVAYTPARMFKVKDRLREMLEQNDWTCNVVKKTTKTGLFTKDRFQETWRCKTDTGDAFDLQICAEQGDDARLIITVPEDSKADKIQITTQIYQWLEIICLGKS